MKLRILNITLLFASIASSSATANRNLAVCEDMRGKFFIPQLEENKNCQFVRNHDIELCTSSNTVLANCPFTCGACDSDHDHHHVDEHLQMSCEEDDELYLEHIVEIEEYCEGVLEGTDTECPYLCLQPMSVLHLYYSVTCPNDVDVDATYTAVEASNKCHADDHGHEEPAADEEEHADDQDEVCEDMRGKFFIPQLEENKNCQFVRNHDIELCTSSNTVLANCPFTCGACDSDHDHHHVDEHLQMSCEEDDELYLEHIVEIEEYCEGVLEGTDTECPYLCLQPMSVLHLYYSVTCPNVDVDATYTAVEASNKCHADDHGHEEPAADTEDEVCEDTRGKFSIPKRDYGVEKNCQFVRNNDMTLCEDSWKVRTRCPLTCGECV